MNRGKKYFSVIAIAMFVLGMVSCKKPVESVTLDKTSLTLIETESATLVATVLPEKAANKSVTWSSSNPLVASVMPNGFVTAISKGTTTIMVSTVDGNKTASCVVKVEERVPVISVILNKNSLTLEAGKSETLIATVLPDNANDKTVTWSSNNSAVATVVNGLVSAKANGEAIITVTTNDGNKTATCIVRIGFHPAEPEMVFVEGGTFTMGCTDGDCHGDEELPAHQVTLSSFKMAKYTVTQKQWVAIMGSNPSSNKGDNLPVTNVNWNDAQEFIRRLNDSTGKQYRLPTEAEWEFAARGGNKGKNNNHKYSGGNDANAVGWYAANSNNQTQPVGMKQPNELGIYDMSGNVHEWCNDWYDDDYYSISPQNNPQGPASGTCRVLRGGDYTRTVLLLRVSKRGCYAENVKNVHSGFRLVHP